MESKRRSRGQGSSTPKTMRIACTPCQLYVDLSRIACIYDVSPPMLGSQATKAYITVRPRKDGYIAGTGAPCPFRPPPMDRALPEELRLRVQLAKGPMKVLLTDHINKPSENWRRSNFPEYGFTSWRRIHRSCSCRNKPCCVSAYAKG